jgi:hypothetical protein
VRAFFIFNYGESFEMLFNVKFMSKKIVNIKIIKVGFIHKYPDFAVVKVKII